MDRGLGRSQARRARRLLPFLLAVPLVWGSASAGDPVRAASLLRADVLVYGGTPSGVLAAVTASRAGADVILLEPRRHLGGMMSSGLGWTDYGNKNTLRGYTGEFFDRTEAAEGTADGRYRFQPHTAEDAFRAMLHSTTVRVRYGERLDETAPVTKDGTRIRTIRTTTGTVYQAAIFIDASYEADLMAGAGVSYRVGRESTSALGESLAGVRPSQLLVTLQASDHRPFVASPPRAVGSADTRIQASNYRLCFSSDPANQVPFAKPQGYQSFDYDDYVRYLTARADATGEPAKLAWILGISPVAGQKFDVNDVGPLSTAVPGLNWRYPEGDNATRLEIEAAHTVFTQGLLYHLRNNRRVPFSVRSELAKYGLCKDEFADNGHWPWLLYLREGRRMIGAYVLRQSDIETNRAKADVVGIASYRVDSHFVSRWIDDHGRLFVEGTMSLPYRTYAIPYRAITPKRSEVTNLLVPVAASASHVAQASLRMEPQYMLMGEAAGEAAAMAVRHRTGARPSPRPTAGQTSTPSTTTDPSPTPPASSSTFVPAGIDVQAIDVGELQRRLKAHGSYLVNPGSAAPALSSPSTGGT